MKFGEADLGDERLQLFNELLRKPEFRDHIYLILDQAVKFPIKNSSVLEDLLWEIWSKWRKMQKVHKDEMLGFHARIILGLLAALINSYAEGADNLSKVLSVIFDLTGLNRKAS